MRAYYSRWTLTRFCLTGQFGAVNAHYLEKNGCGMTLRDFEVF